jgi:hypothetical protein
MASWTRGFRIRLANWGTALAQVGDKGKHTLNVARLHATVLSVLVAAALGFSLFVLEKIETLEEGAYEAAHDAAAEAVPWSWQSNDFPLFQNDEPVQAQCRPERVPCLLQPLDAKDRMRLLRSLTSSMSSWSPFGDSDLEVRLPAESAARGKLILQTMTAIMGQYPFGSKTRSFEIRDLESLKSWNSDVQDLASGIHWIMNRWEGGHSRGSAKEDVAEALRGTSASLLSRLDTPEACRAASVGSLIEDLTMTVESSEDAADRHARNFLDRIDLVLAKASATSRALAKRERYRSRRIPIADSRIRLFSVAIGVVFLLLVLVANFFPEAPLLVVALPTTLLYAGLAIEVCRLL